MPGHVKHNAPGGHINPHLKINREDLLLLPSADYHRLIESRSPSPLPEHANRMLSSTERLDATGTEVEAAIAAAAATAQTSTTSGDQSSVDESEPEGAAQPPDEPAVSSGEDLPAATGKDDQPTEKPPAAGDHRSSITRKHP